MTLTWNENSVFWILWIEIHSAIALFHDVVIHAVSHPRGTNHVVNRFRADRSIPEHAGIEFCYKRSHQTKGDRQLTSRSLIWDADYGVGEKSETGSGKRAEVTVSQTERKDRKIANMADAGVGVSVRQMALTVLCSSCDIDSLIIRLFIRLFTGRDCTHLPLQLVDHGQESGTTSSQCVGNTAHSER